VLLLERRSAQSARTAALNQLHALVITAPPRLRARLEHLRGQPLAKRAAALRSGEECVPTLRRLGRRVLSLGDEVEAVDGELAQLVGVLAPALLAEGGVGPVASGKTKREALRCVKRMLARYFYRRLCAMETLALAEATP
jgi:transposase